jgi:putative ferrous iron transport protein C
MILSDIRKYLEQRGQASLADIALHFHADPDAVRGMLEAWIRKGKVIRRASSASCGSTCQSCNPAGNELYIWSRRSIHVDMPERSHSTHH